MKTDIFGTMKILIILSVDEDEEQPELSTAIAEERDWYKHFGKRFGSTCKAKRVHT